MANDGLNFSNDITYKDKGDRVVMVERKKPVLDPTEELAVCGVVVFVGCDESVPPLPVVWDGSLTVIGGLSHSVGSV